MREERAKRIERIREMEEILNAAAERIRALSDAAEAYAEALDGLRALGLYYNGPLWREDFEADEAGELPDDLRRGVLSEDAVYDLFAENRELLDRLRTLLAEAEEP